MALQQSISVLGKIKVTLDWLSLNLDTSKLESGEEKYTHYFVSYFDECSRAICEKDGVEYDDANRFMVYVEAATRCADWRIENQEAVEKATDTPLVN